MDFVRRSAVGLDQWFRYARSSLCKGVPKKSSVAHVFHVGVALFAKLVGARTANVPNGAVTDDFLVGVFGRICFKSCFCNCTGNDTYGHFLFRAGIQQDVVVWSSYDGGDSDGRLPQFEFPSTEAIDGGLQLGVAVAR